MLGGAGFSTVTSGVSDYSHGSGYALEDVNYSTNFLYEMIRTSCEGGLGGLLSQHNQTTQRPDCMDGVGRFISVNISLSMPTHHHCRRRSTPALPEAHHALSAANRIGGAARVCAEHGLVADVDL